MNRLRLYLHRLFRRPVITDPMRIYTRPIPDGMAIGVEDYFTYVIGVLADDPDAYAMFQDIVDDRALSREHDGWEPERLLLEKLAAFVGCEIRVRGESLRLLGERLLSAAPGPSNVVPIPTQREDGAAA
ncbi:hypothetical protein [Streptomyces sp. YKOK-I1]